MRLELGSDVSCVDGPYGRLVDVVIDPIERRITHLVVRPHSELGPARLVPVRLAEPGEGPGISLAVTSEEVRGLEPVKELAYLRLGEFPLSDPDWDVGIEQVLALPYYDVSGLDPVPLDFEVVYDRIPKGEVEIRRASTVDSADGHRVGQVDGFVVDRDRTITHLVVERGPAWERREIAVPIGAVARVENDAVTLKLTKDVVGSLSPIEVRRWTPPRPSAV